LCGTPETAHLMDSGDPCHNVHRDPGPPMQPPCQRGRAALTSTDKSPKSEPARLLAPRYRTGICPR
jgi:hypothetical protein